jgi:hypothetical protein
MRLGVAEDLGPQRLSKSAMEDAVGQPGETVSAEAVPYSITCTGRASGGRGPAH